MAVRTKLLSPLDGWLVWLGLLAFLGSTTAGIVLPPPLNQVGLSDLALLATSLYCCWALARGGIPGHLLIVLAGFLAVGLLYFIGFVVNPTLAGAKNFLGILISGSFLFFFEQKARTSDITKVGIWALIGFALLCVVLGGLQKNTLSAIAGYLILAAGVLAMRLSASPVRAGSLAFAAVMIIALAMNHRTMMVMGFVAWIAFLAMVRFPWRINRMMLLMAAAGGIFLFMALNIGLFGLSIRDYNSLALEYTGRNALSGRQLIWPILVRAVTSSEWGLWFGLGTGHTFSDLYESHWSAHNYYLQTFMQAGIVGLVLLIALLYSMWHAIGRASRADPLRHYLTAVLAIVIVHSSMTVFLLQVNLTIAINVWAGLGLGFGLLRRSAAPAKASRRHARATAQPVRLAYNRGALR